MKNEVTYRYITPVFNQTHFVDFEHSGDYKDSKFSISLKGYGKDHSPFMLPEHDLNELLKYGSDGVIKELGQMNHSKRFFPPWTSVVMVVDVTQPLNPDGDDLQNSEEIDIIFESIASALSLHLSKGFAFEYSYIFNSASIGLFAGVTVKNMRSETSSGYTTLRPHTIPVPSSRFRLGSGLSVINNENDCKRTFDRLLEKEWNDTDTFDNVLQLAIEYHRTSFTLEKVDHAFLILMVVFEALFKKESESNASKAAIRISELIALTKEEKNIIQKKFFNNQKHTFCKIRNYIAHGSPGLDYKMMKDKYQELYGYITQAIISLLILPKDTIDTDYYEELNSYVENRFSSLPTK